MELLGDLNLAVDDVVVYASHGVGRVASRREQSVVVEFAADGLSVTLPIERASKCIRPVSTEAEIVGLGETLAGPETAMESNWQRRLKAATAKVAGGEAVGLAEVIRDASRRDERAIARNEPGKLSLTERQLYLKARRLLADEIGASRGVDPSYADAGSASRSRDVQPASRCPRRTARHGVPRRRPRRHSSSRESVRVGVEADALRSSHRMKQVSPGRAGRRDAASSVAPIALLLTLPASLPRTRPSHPVAEASFCESF